jgi:hypothetical protein
LKIWDICFLESENIENRTSISVPEKKYEQYNKINDNRIASNIDLGNFCFRLCGKAGGGGGGLQHWAERGEREGERGGGRERERKREKEGGGDAW